VKKLILFLLLVQSASASWCHIVDWRSYPGARVKGQCSIYAKAVESDLESRGYTAHVIHYRWRHRDHTGIHAIVLFRYGGTWSVVDNERTDPCPVGKFVTPENGWTANGLLRAVKFFDSRATEITYVY